MITMLQNWPGAVEVNGKQYSSIRDVDKKALFNGMQVSIKLLPKQAARVENSTVRATQGVDKAVVTTEKEYKITVKKYMTQKTEPGSSFDFMEKWNNNNPMPLRTMQGWIEKETRGMVYMHLHGVGQQEITCMRCGRRLTHPVSRHYGIGPECMQKVGIVADIEDVEAIKEQLVKVEWTGWVIKSAITEQEEV